MSLMVEKLSVAYRGQPAILTGFDLTVQPGEILTVMGPSGCGKSTLLAAISGQLPKSAEMQGEIWLEGRALSRVSPEKRRIGVLFQDSALFPHLDVAANLAFGMRKRGRKARAEAIGQALARAGLAGYERRDPASLSGGQAARVVMMRLLLSAPSALLLDEPFSKLDASRRADLRAFVFQMAREAGLPTVLVTHDAEDARAAGGRVVQLSAP